MRVVVLCADPAGAEFVDGSVPAILRDLGCDVICARFDLGGLDEAALVRRSPAIVVVDAGDEVERAHLCLRRLGSFAPLAEVPALVALTLPRLPAFDFSRGASDFILKPVVPAELYARLRQLDWKSAVFGTDESVKVGELVIDIAGYEASLRGRKLELTRQEFELLRFLAQQRGRVFTRDQLLQKVWGAKYEGGTRTVDIHVRRLRAKLGATVGSLIETVRNVGYKMRGTGATGDGG
ncbi:MAG: response regulator transcription factor [Myxococcales bacterium]|nr:response regulator transcription factor [Myxococcales bacterium]